MSGGIYMHHCVIGKPLDKRMVVDHINTHKLDNRRENLHHVTWAENAHNRGVEFWAAKLVRRCCDTQSDNDPNWLPCDPDERREKLAWRPPDGELWLQLCAAANKVEEAMG